MHVVGDDSAVIFDYSQERSAAANDLDNKFLEFPGREPRLDLRCISPVNIERRGSKMQ